MNLEFVSANPTGPITIASARHAAYGDSLARILERAGHRVEREYYVNDAGSQVQRFGESIQARARGEEPPDDGYRGDYVVELAERIEGAADADPDELAQRGIELMVEGVKAALARFRVHMDEFFSERTLHASRRCPGGHRAAREPGVRARRRAVDAHHRPRRRQGPRAAALERRVDLLRLGHRLPRPQDRARLRPRDRRLGPGPPRPHQADEDRVGGARRRPGRLRDHHHAARRPHRGGGARDDVEAPRGHHRARRPGGRHRGRRRALVPRLTQPRLADRDRPRAREERVAGQPRLLRAVRACADRVDPPQGGRGAGGSRRSRRTSGRAPRASIRLRARS